MKDCFWLSYNMGLFFFLIFYLFYYIFNDITLNAPPNCDLFPPLICVDYLCKCLDCLPSNIDPLSVHLDHLFSCFNILSRNLDYRG